MKILLALILIIIIWLMYKFTQVRKDFYTGKTTSLYWISHPPGLICLIQQLINSMSSIFLQYSPHLPQIKRNIQLLWMWPIPNRKHCKLKPSKWLEAEVWKSRQFKFNKSMKLDCLNILYDVVPMDRCLSLEVSVSWSSLATKATTLKLCNSHGARKVSKMYVLHLTNWHNITRLQIWSCCFLFRSNNM